MQESVLRYYHSWEEMHCWFKLFAMGFLWVLGLFICLLSFISLQVKKWSWQPDIWLRTLGAGLLGPALAPWESLSTWRTLRRVLGTREESRQGPLAESPCKRKRTHLGLCGLLWNLCLGKVPFLRLEVMVGRLAGALELPNYLVFFLPWRTNVRFCLLLLLCFKGSEVQRWQIFC